MTNIYTSLFIGKYNSKRELKYAYHSCSFRNNIIELINLESAEYVLLAHIDKHNLPETEDPSFLGSLQIYSKKELYFTLTLNDKEDPGILITELLHDYYKQFHHSFTDTMHNLQNDGSAFYNKFTIPGSNYKIVIFENNKKSSELQLEIDLTFDKDNKDFGNILTDKKNNYVVKLGTGENFINISYRCTTKIEYNRFMKNIVTNDEHKKLVKQGKQKSYFLNKKECFCYYYLYDYGLVINIPNMTMDDFLEININFTKNDNLKYEGELAKNMLIFVPPFDEEYVFLQTINDKNGYTIIWDVTGNILQQ